MKQISTLFFILIAFFSIDVFAQLRPSQSQYLETVGAFVNPSFEQGFKGWTISGCTKSLENDIPYLNKSLKLSCSSSTVSVKQTITTLTPFDGSHGQASCTIRATAGGVKVRTKKNAIVENTSEEIGTNYKPIRLESYVGDTSNEIEIFASAFTGDIFIDDCSYKPIATNIFQGKLNPVKNWSSFIPTTTWDAQLSSKECQVREVGDSDEYVCTFIVGATISSGIFILDSKNPIDYSKLSGDSTTNAGFAWLYDANLGANRTSGVVTPNNGADSVRIFAQGGSLVTDGTPFTWVSTDSIRLNFTLPVLGRTSATDAVAKDTIRTYEQAGFLVWSAGDLAETDDLLKADGRCVLESKYPDYKKNVGEQYGDCTITTSGDGMLLPDLLTSNRLIRNAGGSLALGTIQNDDNGVHTHDAGGMYAQIEINSSGNVNSREKSVPSWTTSARANASSGLSTITVSNGSYVLGTSSNDNGQTSETKVNSIAMIAFVRMKNLDTVIAGTFENINSTDLLKVRANNLTGETSTTSFAYNYMNNLTEIEDDFNALNDVGNIVFTAPPEKQVAYYDFDFAARIDTGATVASYECGLTISSAISNSRARVISGDGTSVNHLKCSFENIKLEAGDTVQFYSRKGGTDSVVWNTDTRFTYLEISQDADYEAIVKNMNDNKSIECQTKRLTASTDTQGIVAELGFSNLTIGKNYSITSQARCVAGDVNCKLRVRQGAVWIATTGTQPSGAGSEDRFHLTFHMPFFTATETSLVHEVSATSASFSLEALSGNSEGLGTFSTLCELNDNYIETNKF